MATCRGGSSVKTKLGFLIYGEQGTYKSSLCLEFLKYKTEDGKPFKVLYIDAESGSIESYLELYENEGIDTQNIYIVYTQSLTEVNEFIDKAKNNENFYIYDDNGNESSEVYLDSEGNPFRPDAIVVDGVTVLYIASQQGLYQFSKKRATVRANKNELTGMAKEVAIESSGLEIKDYNTLKINGQNLILDLLACGKHFAVTMREEDEKESYKDKNGEIKSMATGRKQPAGFKDVRFNVKSVLRMFKDDDGIVKGIIEGKDRTLVHKQDEILVEPTLTDWQVVIDKNKGKKDYAISNTLNDSVEKELKTIEKNNARFEDDYEKTSDNTKNGELSTIEDYYSAIKNSISKMNQTDKAKIQTSIAEAGLPKAYQTLKDIEKLKTYLTIINNG